MSESTPPPSGDKPARRGRSLRPQQESEPDFDSLPDAAEPSRGTLDGATHHELVEALGLMDPDPDPVQDGGYPIAVQGQPIDPGPAGLIWNHTAGIRLGLYHEAARDDDDGTIRTDGAGHPIWAVRHTERLMPGLNVVGVELWGKLRQNLRERIKAGELQSLGDDPAKIAPHRLIKAIQETGADAPILWLLKRERRRDVIDALERQRQQIATGGVARAS